MNNGTEGVSRAGEDGKYSGLSAKEHEEIGVEGHVMDPLKLAEQKSGSPWEGKEGPCGMVLGKWIDSASILPAKLWS